MTEQSPSAAADYKDTVFLPQTDFPMKAGLAQKEPAILARWQEQDLYARLREARKGREKFILHDGPPYANGDMHIGHALNHILKDMVCRTQSLLGKDAPYVPGWDCHGLPIEWKIEEQYRKKKLNKDEVDPVAFRAECRAYAQHWVDTQREQLKRLGILGDWDNPYLTMDFAAEATIVQELMKFAESGQLYRGAKPVMWSPVEKTALAEAEVEYQDVTSTQIDVAFEIVDAPNAPELVGAFAVIWTTTPWTIPVNQALAYGPEVDYTMFEVKTGEFDDKPHLEWMRDKRFVVAAKLVPDFLRRIGCEFDNSDSCLFESVGGAWPLKDATARHPMHALGGFFAKPRPFLPGDFVTTDAGTGLVHMAPDHGEDDFDLCKAHGLEPVFAVEGDGRYRDDWAWLGGADEPPRPLTEPGEDERRRGAPEKPPGQRRRGGAHVGNPILLGQRHRHRQERRQQVHVLVTVEVTEGQPGGARPLDLAAPLGADGGDGQPLRRIAADERPEPVVERPIGAHEVAERRRRTERRHHDRSWLRRRIIAQHHQTFDAARPADAGLWVQPGGGAPVPRHAQNPAPRMIEPQPARLRQHTVKDRFQLFERLGLGLAAYIRARAEAVGHTPPPHRDPAFACALRIAIGMRGIGQQFRTLPADLVPERRGQRFRHHDGAVERDPFAFIARDAVGEAFR